MVIGSSDLGSGLRTDVRAEVGTGNRRAAAADRGASAFNTTDRAFAVELDVVAADALFAVAEDIARHGLVDRIATATDARAVIARDGEAGTFARVVGAAAGGLSADSGQSGSEHGSALLTAGAAEMLFHGVFLLRIAEWTHFKAKRGIPGFR